MNEIFSNLSSISWWFGVIFVGILVSLGGSYLKPYTDEWLAKHSKSRKNKNDEEREKWANEVLRLQRDENYRILFISRITHAHGRSNFLMLSGVSMFLIGGIISLVFQLPNIVTTEESNIVTNFLSTTLGVQIEFIIKVFTALIGTISFLLGIKYFESSERLQKQLEESVEKITKEKNFYDK